MYIMVTMNQIFQELNNKKSIYMESSPMLIFVHVCNDMGMLTVDGEFTEWSMWSNCDVTCGGGVQSRDRTCFGPFHGGKDCQGDPTETIVCNSQSCPGMCMGHAVRYFEFFSLTKYFCIICLNDLFKKSSKSEI